MCDPSKPFEDFAWRRKADNERDSYCRPCRAIYKQHHYAMNKARYKANAAEYVWKTALLRAAWLFDYFKDHPCSDCGETDPLVLEFDHLRDKHFDIARGIRNKNWDVFIAELAKCEVVCANCHRIRTGLRAGFARLRV
ncbi:MAG: hypothetical protein Q8K63_06460 [Acidimicrobiales bacterium]|nr:hypothetical protein [Acidimicrobiales bacterium]